MRVLIVTTKQPSTNPRMRKAADALSDAGYTVHVLYAYNAAWASKADENILRSCNWTYELIGGDPSSNYWKYQLSRVSRKWAEKTGQLERAWCRSHDEFVKKGIAFQPNLVIGHNPGSLSPTSSIAAALNIPCMFDAEDYHRGEQDANSMQSRQVTALEDRFIPHLSAMTAASPMIGAAYSKLYPGTTITTVNNAFPKTKAQTSAQPGTGPLRMVWFSQVVGLDRGLEPFIKGMSMASDIPIELTIIGQCTHDVKSELHDHIISPQHSIHFKEPMDEPNLFTYLSEFEIGLALEVSVTENRRLCRTNKLYTYPLAGCFTLASDTPSQVQFYEEYPELGQLINLDDASTIRKSIASLWEEREQLGRQRETILRLAKNSLNWEVESNALVMAVQDLISKN